MDFWDATKVMVRRWYLALPLLLLTFGGTAYTATAIEPDFVLTSYIQLIPPQTQLTEEEARKYPVNPWNQLGLEALSQAANYATLDATFLDKLDKEGYTTNLKITTGDPVAGATIEVIGKTKAQAMDTTDLLIKQFKESTLALQAQYRVRSQDMITVQRLDQGENLKRPGGKVKRAIIAVFGSGMLLTAGVTIGFDAWMRSRRKRADEAGDENDTRPTNGRSAADIAPAESRGRVFTSLGDPRNETGTETVRIQVPTAVSRRAARRQQHPQSSVDQQQPAASPEMVGDATIILPAPRTTLNDKGGNRR